MPHPKRALLAPEPGNCVACFSIAARMPGAALAVAHSGNRRTGAKREGAGQKGKTKSRVPQGAYLGHE